MKVAAFAEDSTLKERNLFPGKDVTVGSEKPSPVWSYSIRSCLSQKKPKEAILIYTRNRRNGNFVIAAIPLVLKACASLAMVCLGKELHSEILKSGVECDVMVGTSLVDMYGKCRDIVNSRKVFDHMREKNVVTWNSLIGGYMRDGKTQLAFALFQKMSRRTSVTWNEMIDGYAKSGDMPMARWAFESMPEGMKNVVSWTVLVDGYVSNGDMKAAGEVFRRMNVKNFYVWSVMMTGYFRIGDVLKAREIFDKMNFRNLVNWNALISGYAQNGRFNEALDAFSRMQAEGFEPDEVTFASILSACAQSGMLDVGKDIHDMIIQKRIQLNEFVLNGLIDMYAKCGDLGNACLIFDGMTAKSSTTWNSLITGFAIHGQCSEAVDFFSRMEESRVKPDSVSFLSVLSACSHGGFVEEGLAAFLKMEKYGLTANMKHYGCLVDLLGRAGKLQDALNLVTAMPIAPNETVLGALLGACRIHCDTVMTEKVLELVRKLNSCPGFCKHPNYVLLSSIYAASERWERAQGIRAMFSARGSEKSAGHSSLNPNAHTLYKSMPC